MLDFHVSVLQEKREQAAEAAAMKKDPDAYRAKMEAMEVARMRMQEKYDQVERNVVGLVCRGYDIISSCNSCCESPFCKLFSKLRKGYLNMVCCQSIESQLDQLCLHLFERTKYLVIKGKISSV